MTFPIGGQTYVEFDNIAERCHMQYLVEACKNSEDGLDQHALDLCEKFAISFSQYADLLILKFPMSTEKETAFFVAFHILFSQSIGLTSFNGK